MKKLKMHSPDLTDENIAKIRELFPNCVSEATDENGKLRLAVDFDQLKQELSDSIVEGPQERYRLDWPGKREALLTANAPIAKTLRPCRAESVDFDTTQNLFIEGDNLDALKLLQETYLGKVKMIYIDPPYNTGKDFIYKDNFAADKQDYLEDSGQVDEEGGKLITNPESNGRYHSDWLSMMYPRLRLARNLLANDGVIFISIDDGEVGNLRKCCDEVFGEENLIANIVWQKKYTRSNDARWFSDNHDHLLCYAKEKIGMLLNLLPRNEKQLAAYSNPDNHPKGSWKATPLHAKSGSNTAPFVFKNGVKWEPPVGTFRRFNDEAMDRMDDGGEIWFGSDGNQIPSRKSFLCEVKDGVSPVTIWPYDEVGHNHEANSELKALELGGLFSNPKPTRLIKRALHLSTDKNDLIVDFFAGSSTTADAVLQLNATDGLNRKFIMVQLPEVTDEKSEAFKAGYKNIAEISKERIRRAGKKIKENLTTEGTEKHRKNDVLFDFSSVPSVPSVVKNIDVGFRVLKIDTSNMADVYYTPEATKQDDLLAAVDNIKPGRDNPEDLLFQVLVDWGVDLTLPIHKKTITTEHTDKNNAVNNSVSSVPSVVKQSFDVFFVNHKPYDLIACFDKGITEELVKKLAAFKPVRVVFRDNGFVSDAVKINVDQIFRQLSPSTEVKSI